jgi:hypothetical protein
MLTAKEARRASTERLIEFIEGRIERCAYNIGKTKLVLNLEYLPEKVYKLLSVKGYKIKYEENMEGTRTVISWRDEDEGSES